MSEEMDIEKAKRIISHCQDNRMDILAKGFIEGWNARGVADEQAIDNYHHITVDDSVTLKNEIYALSVDPSAG